MPFSSQPRKKASSITKACEDGEKNTSSQVSKTTSNAAAEKQKIASLQNKILDLFAKDKRGLEKAVHVLADWIKNKG